MKKNTIKINTLLAACVLSGAFGLSSCGLSIRSRENDAKRVLSISQGFDEIESTGFTDVEYTDGEPKIVLYAPKDQIGNIKVEIRGNKLMVSNTDENNMKNYIGRYSSKLVVSYPGVTRFSSYGTGDFEMKDLRGSNYSFGTYGTGDFECGTVSADTIICETYGTGDIELGGAKCGQLKVITSGTGDIEVKGIMAGFVSAVTSGTGDIELIGECKGKSFETSGTGDINSNKLIEK